MSSDPPTQVSDAEFAELEQLSDDIRQSRSPRDPFDDLMRFAALSGRLVGEVRRLRDQADEAFGKGVEQVRRRCEKAEAERDALSERFVNQMIAATELIAERDGAVEALNASEDELYERCCTLASVLGTRDALTVQLAAVRAAVQDVHDKVRDGYYGDGTEFADGSLLIDLSAAGLDGAP